MHIVIQLNQILLESHVTESLNQTSFEKRTIITIRITENGYLHKHNTIFLNTNNLANDHSLHIVDSAIKADPLLPGGRQLVITVRVIAGRVHPGN